MSVSTTAGAGPTRSAVEPSASAAAARSAPLLTAGLSVFAVYHLALAGLMAIAPHAFYTAIGPFGTRNDHYIRDTATFSAALGVGLAIAIRRSAWRVPVLAIVVVQFALHSANHLLDLGAAHPAWKGYLDFASLLASTAVLAWLLLRARHRAATPLRSEGVLR